MKISGIYIIRNSINNKVYIGSACSIGKRFNVHKCLLLKGKHHSRSLQNFVSKHGFETLSFSPIEYCDIGNLIVREQYWIDFYQSANPRKGFNACPIAGSRLGIPHSEDTKNKLRGKKHSEETRQKLRNRVYSDEFRAKMSLIKTGLKQSEETKQKRRSFRHSAESKKKMSIASASRKHSAETIEKMRLKVFSETHREKLSKAGKGRIFSEEHKRKLRMKTMSEESRKKLSALNKGKKLSEETKRKKAQSLLSKKASPESLENRRQTRLRNKGTENASVAT